MSSQISIKNYIDISNKVVNPPDGGRFTAYPLWLVNSALIGRGQAYFISSVQEAEELFHETNLINFIRDFFNFKDKVNNSPLGLFIGSSTLEKIEPKLISSRLNSVPPQDLSGRYSLIVSSGDQVKNVSFTLTSSGNDWATIANEITQALQKEFPEGSLLTDVKATWDNVNNRLIISGTAKTGDKSSITADLSNESNKKLGFFQNFISVAGGEAISFSDNVKRYFNLLNNEFFVLAWDNVLSEDDDIKELTEVVRANNDQDFPKIICFPASDKVATTAMKDTYTNVAFCYHNGAAVNKYFSISDPALFITQQAAATRFEDNGVIPDFNFFPTTKPGQVFSQELKDKLDSLRGNYVTQLKLGVLETNMIEGGEAWGNKYKDLIVLKNILGSMWLRYIISFRLLQYMQNAPSFDDSPHNMAAVRGVLDNAAVDAISYNIFNDPENMTADVQKTIPKEILESILANRYYLDVKIGYNQEKDVRKKVIKYVLAYYASGLIKKIIGIHQIYTDQ